MRAYSAYITVKSAAKVSVLLITACIISCAEAPKKTAGEMICVEHGKHRASVKEDFAACFGIDSSKFNEFYYFTKESTYPAKDEAEGTAQLKELVKDDIVDTIMKRLEASFGNELNANWQLEQIDLPVPFRTFIRKNSGSVDIKVIGVVRKKDLAPAALIHFLPLEYKMKILKTDGKEKLNQGNP